MGKNILKSFGFTEADTITDRIAELCQGKQISLFKLRAELNIPKSSFYEMYNRQSEWRLEYLVRISEYFEVSLDWLIKGKTPDRIEIKKLEQEKQELSDEVNRLRTFVSSSAELLAQVKNLEKSKRKNKK